MSYFFMVLKFLYECREANLIKSDKMIYIYTYIHIYTYIYLLILDAGYFALLNVRNQKFNDTAVLRSPDIQSSHRSVCFKFFYFMYGHDVNVLNIYSVVGSNRERCEHFFLILFLYKVL